MPEFIHGDARAIPLPDASVDLIVTSPPYFGLRSYTDGGAHYTGQIGDEATPREFLAALLEVTAECARVLKPTGSMFINLGDKYNGNRGQGTIQDNAVRQSVPRGNGLDVKDVRAKSLLLIPERYRIACVDELGLIARAVIVWSKPNGLPESVTDRVRRSHEDWVHLTKAPRYFAAVDEIREPHERTWTPGRNGGHARAGLGGTMAGLADAAPNPLGKLPGSVWEIPTQPLKVPAELGVDHFAAFPMEWPRRLILGWSPREVCTVCGEGRRPVADRSEKHLHRPSGAARMGSHFDSAGPARVRHDVGNVHTVHRITGYACACPDTSAPATPGTVLDPFSGTGTTALVATMLGRRGIGVDLSADYLRLAEWRAADPKERARAAGLDPDDVAKVPQQITGQFDLFGDEAAS